MDPFADLGGQAVGGVGDAVGGFWGGGVVGGAAVDFQECFGALAVDQGHLERRGTGDGREFPSAFEDVDFFVGGDEGEFEVEVHASLEDGFEGAKDLIGREGGVVDDVAGEGEEGGGGGGLGVGSALRVSRWRARAARAATAWGRGELRLDVDERAFGGRRCARRRARGRGARGRICFGGIGVRCTWRRGWEEGR